MAGDEEKEGPDRPQKKKTPRQTKLSPGTNVLSWEVSSGQCSGCPWPNPDPCRKAAGSFRPPPPPPAKRGRGQYPLGNGFVPLPG